jgi:hypothetical protein
MRRLILCFLLSLCVSLAASAGPPVSLTLQPAKIPSPALKYPLLPDQRQQTNADAAPIYREAIKASQRLQVVQQDELYKKWLATPLAELPRQAVAEQMMSAQEVFDLLDKAARCTRCDWGTLEAVRKEGVFAQSREVDALERLASLSAMRVRWQLAEGHTDQAIAALQTALAMARHVGESHTFFHFTTGQTLANVLRQLDAFVETPGTPNLYWSLATLPRPLIDARNAMQGERLWAQNLFPGLADVLNDPQAGVMTPELLQKCGRLLEGVRFEPNRNFLDRMNFVKELKAKHEVAKAALIAAGRPRAKVEAMPHIQAALLHSYLELDQRYDEIDKWRNTPYWEIVEFTKMEKNGGRLKERPLDAPAVPLADMFFGGPEKLLLRSARLERDIALWRTIEMLRHYAATHDGQLPPKLDAVKELPLPLNPFTGKPFEYERAGDMAILRAVALPLWPKEVVIYELKMNR